MDKLLSETMSDKEKRLAMENSAMKDPEHLKLWLEKSGRRYLVFDGLELVDSLRFPEGVDRFMEIVACYSNHRRTIPSGRFEEQEEPTLGKRVTIPVMKGETLEIGELDRVIRYLVRQITDKEPTWSLDNPPK